MDIDSNKFSSIRFLQVNDNPPSAENFLSDDNSTVQYVIEQFYSRYNVTNQAFQEVNAALFSLLSAPVWDELTANISALPLPDPVMEVKSRTASLAQLFQNITDLTPDWVLSSLPSADQREDRQSFLQVTLSTAIQNQLQELTAVHDLKNIVFFNTPVQDLKVIPDQFDIQIGRKDKRTSSNLLYTSQKGNHIFTSHPLGSTPQRMRKRERVLKMATAVTAKVASELNKMNRTSVALDALSALKSEVLAAPKATSRLSRLAGLVYLTSTTIESILQDAKEYLPTEAQSKIREEFKNAKQVVLKEYEKIRTGLRSEISGWLSSEIITSIMAESEISGWPIPGVPDFLESAVQYMQPIEKSKPDLNWNASLSAIVGAPSIDEDLSETQSWSGGRNYPLLLHSCILLAQAPYNLERNYRLNASSLEQIINDLSAISSTSGRLLPEKWNELISSGGISNLFPQTKSAMQNLLSKTSNAASLFKELGSTKFLASFTNGSNPAPSGVESYGEYLKNMHSPFLSRLKETFQDPSLQEFLSTQEYKNVIEGFANELQTLVAELEIPPELQVAADSLSHLRKLINGTSDVRVLSQPPSSTVAVLAQKAFGNSGNHLQVFSIVSDKAVAVFCRDPVCDLTCVSFRGTKDSTDVITDITFLPSPIKPLFAAGSDYVNSGMDQMNVHQGFGIAFESIETQVTELLTQWPSKHVLFTGHSMGGALAQIAAVRFSHLKPTLVTFGAPAIGNQEFCRFVEAVAHPHGGLRVWNEFDIVPALAQLVGYSHAGVPVLQKVHEQSLKMFEIENKNGVFPGFAAVAPHVLYHIGPVEYVFPVMYSNIQPFSKFK